MAEKETSPERVMQPQRRRNNPSAGDGGSDGDSAAPPPTRLRLDPSSSAGSSGGGGTAEPPTAPRSGASSSPPEPFTYHLSAGSSGCGDGDGSAKPPPSPQPESSSSPPSSPSSSDDEDSDDSDKEKLSEFELAIRSGMGSLFMSDPRTLSMNSSDPQTLPHYIGRQDCKPLSTQKFLSLHHNWQQLLDGKKTYLRPRSNNRDPEYNYDGCLFERPRPLRRAVECQGPLLLLVRACAGKLIIPQKYKILSEHYVWLRAMRIDGSSFYRAFLLSYLENLGRMQGSQAEVTRLMECLARSRENFCRLRWSNAYFSNPEAFFSSVVSEFVHLVNSAANGLNVDELYKRCLQEITSSRKVHIRTHEANYNNVLGQETSALLFCIKYVRPFDTEAGLVQKRALSEALGIPLRVALVDNTLNEGSVQVKCVDVFPLSESGVSRSSGSIGSIRSYYLSSCNSVMPAGNIFSSHHMPLVNILSTNGNCAILYPK